MKRIIPLIIISTLIFAACAKKAEPLGIFGESRKESVLGQDGVSSIPFDEKITMWTFGDTLLGTWKGNVSTSATFADSADVKSMISNSLAFSDRPTPENVGDLKFTFYRENGRVAPFLKFRPGESPLSHRLWAADGVRLSSGVYVYYMIVEIQKNGKESSYRLSGIGLARWTAPEGWAQGDRVRFMRLGDLFRGDTPAFGAAVMERQGYVYTVGHQSAKDGTSPVKLSRVPADDIADARAYEFLSADGRWVKGLSGAGAFIGDVMGECSLSYNDSLGEYVMVYCQAWTGAIMMVRFRDFASLANAPKEQVYQPPALVQKEGSQQTWYYSGKEVFSWGRSVFAIYIHPLEYQPYLLRIDVR